MKKNGKPANPAAIPTPRFKRPVPASDGPDRRAGTLFRDAGPASGIGGVTLQQTEAAAIAAVRAGYKVAEAQLDRMKRIGNRVRTAGERVVGDEAERQAIDQTERLVGKAILAAVSWVEGLAAEPGSPLHRLAVSQYRLLGGIWGLDGSTPPPASRASRRAGGAAPDDTTPTAPRTPSYRPRPNLGIVLRGDVRRRVLVRDFEFDPSLQQGDPMQPLAFFHAEDLDAEPLEGELKRGADVPLLEIEVLRRSPAGRWCSVVCDAGGRQRGWIEIEI